MRTKYLFFFSTILFFSTCKPEMKPINYGQDGCAFCQMTIVDSRYAGELVTDKGKVYKFDAIECMINYKHEHATTDYALTLVSTIDEKKLKPAADCTYLRSGQLPSPMGMYITGVSSLEMGKKYQHGFGGTLYTWSELNEKFKELPTISQ
ncbi:MAG TPA: nitrous oxide reductase accessory protein NosL [Fulvivirga sp.]|nr:nitrous oxide reductase accessory protein NosL [Fulvivirga sp.]